LKLEKISYKKALPIYKEYYNRFKQGIDGYYEKIILNGDHYNLVDEVTVGIVSINENQLTGFYIFDNGSPKYSEYFTYVLNQDIIKRIMFSTIDKRLYKEIQDRKLKIEFQAYNFIFNSEINTKFRMEFASKDQLKFIEDNFLDFIENSIGSSIESFSKKIEKSEIFIGYDSNDNPISMGVIEQMLLNPSKYCLGMIVLENQRRKCYGIKTLQYLIKYLKDNNREVNARCWYYNEASKKTLLKAGFKVSNLLLRVEDI